MKAKKKKSMSETEYLLSSPANAKRLKESIEEYKASSVVKKKKPAKKKR